MPNFHIKLQNSILELPILSLKTAHFGKWETSGWLLQLLFWRICWSQIYLIFLPNLLWFYLIFSACASWGGCYTPHTPPGRYVPVITLFTILSGIFLLLANVIEWMTCKRLRILHFWKATLYFCVRVHSFASVRNTKSPTNLLVWARLKWAWFCIRYTSDSNSFTVTISFVFWGDNMVQWRGQNRGWGGTPQRSCTAMFC